MKSIIINMRNAVIIFAICWAGSMSAQIYSYDAAIEMPTGNIYDMGAMNSYLNAYRQSMAIKYDNWVKTMTVAMDYFKKGDYVSFINITNSLVEETTVDHFFELRG